MDDGEARLFVSHDRWFIEKFADRIWYLHDGTIQDFRGGYAAWREYLARQDTFRQAAHESQKKARPRQAAKKPTVSRERQEQQAEREIEKAEAAMAALEEEIQANAADYQKLMELTQKQETAQKELDALYERWEELSE